MANFSIITTLFLIFVLNLSIQSSENTENQDSIKNMVKGLMKTSIHDSVLNSTIRIRQRLRDALSFVESAINHAMNCTNCVENYIGLSEGAIKNITKCQGKECDEKIDDINEDLADLPSFSRVVSMKELNGKDKKHGKRPKKSKHPKEKPKLTKPKKEQLVPKNPSTEADAPTINPTAPSATDISPANFENYAGADGQCLQPCSPICAPQCSYECCQQNTVPPPQLTNMNQMMNTNNCPPSCYTQCSNFCPTQCCKSEIPLSAKRSSRVARMLIDHS